MTAFEEFLSDLQVLVQKHTANGLALKIHAEPKCSIVKVFGSDADSLVRARDGMDDIIELAHATAEHHPFSGLLDGSAEITTIVLDKWRDSITESELDELDWHVKTLDAILKRLRESHGAH